MTRKRELEAALEERCVAKVEARGGLALKLVIPGVRGFPDRTILLPRNDLMQRKTLRPGDFVQAQTPKPARVWFAEFKRLKTGAVSAQQHRWRVLLTQLGFGVYFIETDAQFDEAMEKELSR